jgi:hypothetical protein
MTAIGLSIQPGAPRGAPAVAVPTLDLSFLTGTLDARVTPTLRAGSGTAAAGWQFDSAGALVLGSHNLCLQSETFDNASWTKTRSSITANAAVAPDGATTADKIVEDSTASNTHFAIQNVTGAGSTIYTYSVYVKAAGRTFALVQLGGFAQQVASNAVYVNLSTGAFTATDTARTSVTSVGNDWYRVSTTITTIPAGGTLQPSVYPVAVSGTNVYSGDGTSGIYVWGAQLDQSRDLRPYVPSTTVAVYGGARIDRNPATLAVNGLLIEPAATNLILRSSEADNASWTKTRASITANAIVAPDGATTADKLVEDATAANTHEISQAATVAAATVVTCSVFAKAGERDQFAFRCADPAFIGRAFFNLATGAVGVKDAAVTSSSIQSIGNGWYRCSATFTTGASGTSANVYIQMSNGSITYTGDNASGLYLWGAQLEAGSAATSPIVTVGSAVTRAADTATVTVVNLAAGALAVEAIFADTALQAIAVQIDGNTGSNTTRIGVGNNGSGQFRAYFVGGSGSALTAITGGAVAKMAVGWSGTEARGAIGGTLGAAGVMTGALTGATTLRLGRTATASAPFLGHLRRVRLYSARPTDAEILALTA